jgi:hypothetical protein
LPSGQQGNIIDPNRGGGGVINDLKPRDHSLPGEETDKPGRKQKPLPSHITPAEISGPSTLGNKPVSTFIDGQFPTKGETIDTRPKPSSE